MSKSDLPSAVFVIVDPNIVFCFVWLNLYGVHIPCLDLCVYYDLQCLDLFTMICCVYYLAMFMVFWDIVLWVCSDT